MKIPNPPEEGQGSKSEADEVPTTSEQSKRKPKVVFKQGMMSHHPGETGKQLASNPEEEPISHPSPKSDRGVPARNGKDINPGRRLHAFEAAAENAPPTRVPWRYRLRPNRELTHRAYWDVATTFSLIVNAILIGLLLIMAGQIRNLKTTENRLVGGLYGNFGEMDQASINTMMNSLLGGLYSNFGKMDQASVNTNITLNAQIPLDFNLPVSQNTEVVLSRDVNIPDARLVINTGIVNINSRANVTLPAGTTLPIVLNLNIPVQSTIPINLQVPVNIPLSQTGLHEPVTGLQASLRPLYCMFNKNAQYPEGIYICAEHNAPTPGTP